ncbi:hypothetical protein M408DRAFT_194255 [Serendipita vermifera MAFF 305830]|uniref:Uncharacterized protein n=1 Tax=Serendipita vermifera MAFF 305830 TaxID=933852 RepID=A0A0C3B437_SERVB|nr:hypothetical protein M408DRAFT_194255 [Serendipita vermifera MAFF 305830]
MEPVQRERLRFIGVLMRQDITEGVRTSQPFLLRVGWSNALVDRLVAGTIEETQKDTLGFRFRLAWGRRRAGPDLPAPKLPEIDYDEGGETIARYPFYEVYDTPEQAKEATLVRNRGKDIPEPPFLSESI